MSTKNEFSPRVNTCSFACIFLGIIVISSSTNYVNATTIDVIRKTEPIYVNEFFTMLITPDLFLPNATTSTQSSSFLTSSSSSSQNEQFRYRPSLLGHPSLPNWMSFRIAKRKDFGYLYGSATENYAGRKIDIEIIALNKSNYETSRIVIPMKINFKKAPLNKIEMKFTNLDFVNLTNVKTVNSLKGIFTKELWPESVDDLSIVFMESATKLGARLPLDPRSSEGVIIHLASDAKLSTRLIELDQEVKPLLKLTTCTFKKTKAQLFFHKLGFQIDWCAFRIVSQELEYINASTTTTIMKDKNKEDAHMLLRKVWNSVTRDDLPERNYSEEIAIAVAIPSVIFSFLVALLTVVLCFQHDKFEHQKSNSEPVQMVQYSGTSKNPPVTALKSLHDPYADNLSLDSDSPSSNVLQEGSPKLNPYYRPNPPAYKSGKSLFLQFNDGPSTSSTVRFKNDI
ncbi:hypothetical protein PVAND_005694 [Polypedilum vanderplanki]|uniref:Epsilon-sarcoglycan n=1 Tax=Polypedilum vanderplanki TaxID=319348 RepID=A0A9J6C1R1_POLVA|nr:hypothetical protein PVAND_005694 [Polypedilum vanderplanki]